MLESIAVLLILIWFVGVISGYASGSFIYVPLTMGIVLLVARLVGGHRAPPRPRT